MERVPSSEFQRIKTALKQSTIFDGRNLYDPPMMRALDFRYYSIGRRPLQLLV
jgi:UDPglucose 6-dehydrogenase